MEQEKQEGLNSRSRLLMPSGLVGWDPFTPKVYGNTITLKSFCILKQTWAFFFLSENVKSCVTNFVLKNSPLIINCQN